MVLQSTTSTMHNACIMNYALISCTYTAYAYAAPTWRNYISDVPGSGT